MKYASRMGREVAREEHIQAVGFAGMQVEELEGLLVAAREKQQECLGLVITAVGDDPAVESARNAMEFVAGIADRIDEIVGMCESAKSELNRYGGGF